MKYLLLAALVVVGSAYAKTDKESTKLGKGKAFEFNWLGGVGAIALVNKKAGERNIKKYTKEEDNKDLTGNQTMEKNGNRLGSKLAQGGAGFGSLYLKKSKIT